MSALGQDNLLKNWRIYYDPPPIPLRTCDWRYVHKEYDGPEDRRIGAAASYEDAVERIRETMEDTQQD